MAHAFTVSPMSQKIDLKPGDVFEGFILVANPAASTSDFHYVVSLNPFSISGENYDTDFETMSDWSLMVKWTTLEKTQGVLAPNETEKVHFKITVPEDAPAGGQYAMIGVMQNPEYDSSSGESVTSVYEMASLIYASVDGETVHSGQVVETKVPEFLAVGKPTIMNKFSNSGNVHEVANYKITIKNIVSGEQIFPKEGEVNEFESVIMPESTRVILKELPNLPVVGAVEIKEEISYIDNNSTQSFVMVICPAWFIALFFALIISIVSMFFYGRHLKKRKLSRILDSE